MRAHVNQRINALPAEPKIKGDIGMARNAGEIVIVGGAACDLAALGLDSNDGFAGADGCEMKFTVANLRVALWHAPRAR